MLQDDSKESLLVEAPGIGPNRLGLANQGLMPGKGLRELPKAPIEIDIVDYDRTSFP
jgi:hypothetical protein